MTSKQFALSVPKKIVIAMTVTVIGTSLVIGISYSLFSTVSSSKGSSAGVDLLKQYDDAKVRIQEEWTASDYALMKFPKEMISGTWDVSSNVWNCNTELFNCKEVDFKSGDGELGAAWLVSYRKGDHEYCCNRVLSDETMRLFTQRSVPIKGHPTLSSEASTLVTFVREHREVNPASVVPHTAEPLQLDGDWTVADDDTVEKTEGDPVRGDLGACQQFGPNCLDVIYKWTDETNMFMQTCIWRVDRSASQIRIVGANRQAEFFFKKK